MTTNMLHNMRFIHQGFRCGFKELRNLFSWNFLAMKKIAVIPLCATAILAVSCTARFEELNTNPNQVIAGQM